MNVARLISSEEYSTLVCGNPIIAHQDSPTVFLTTLGFIVGGRGNASLNITSKVVCHLGITDSLENFLNYESIPTSKKSTSNKNMKLFTLFQ